MSTWREPPRGGPPPRPTIVTIAVLVAVVVAAAAAAASSAAAAATAADDAADTGWLPFPPGLFPQYGRLPQVAALGCVRDGLHAGGPAPDGRSGYTLDGVWHAAAAGVCAAPLSRLTRLADDGSPTAAESFRGRQVLRMARDFVPGADPTNAYTRYHPLALATATAAGGRVARGGGGGRGGRDDGGRGRPRLAFEADIVALLTLQRNTDAGEVERSSAALEVLSVTRTSRGVCRHQQCNDLTAVDTTGDGACANFNCANRFNPLAANARADLPSFKARARAAAKAAPPAAAGGAEPADAGTVSVVTYTGADGETRYVSMLQAPLLSLGRAVLADSRWLEDPRWALTANVVVENLHRHVLPDGVDAAMEAGVWNLGGRLGDRDDAAAVGATAAPTLTSSWPQMLAYVFCAGGGRAFTFDSGLCDGLFQRTRAVQTRILNGEEVDTSSNAPSPSYAGVFWSVRPRGLRGAAAAAAGAPPSPAPLRRCPVGLAMAATQPLPSWLAGTASREINAAAAAERALAANLSRCAFPLLESSPVDEYGALRATEKSSRVVDLQRLSIGYDQGVFAVPPPPDPASLADVAIALVLVLPEAAAAVVMYLSTARWRRRELLSLGVVLVTGMVALSGILLLALAELRGERWRAASVRSSILVYLTTTAGDCVGRAGPNGCTSPGLRGSALLLSETLIIVARNGYRPRTLAAIAGCFVAVYVAGTIWAVLAVARRLERSRPLDDVADAAAEPGASAKPGDYDADDGGAAHPAGRRDRCCCFGLRARGRRRNAAEGGGDGLESEAPPPWGSNVD